MMRVYQSIHNIQAYPAPANVVMEAALLRYVRTDGSETAHLGSLGWDRGRHAVYIECGTQDGQPAPTVVRDGFE